MGGIASPSMCTIGLPVSLKRFEAIKRRMASTDGGCLVADQWAGQTFATPPCNAASEIETNPNHTYKDSLKVILTQPAHRDRDVRGCDQRALLAGELDEGGFCCGSM